jgi:hypothetical protein
LEEKNNGTRVTIDDLDVGIKREGKAWLRLVVEGVTHLACSCGKNDKREAGSVPAR